MKLTTDMLDTHRGRLQLRKKGTEFSILFLTIKTLTYFFYLCFTARQDYCTHYVPNQSVGGAKTGDPRKKST